jgi:DNA modification methylase
MQPSELKVEYFPVDEVVGYARNSRLHSDEQVTQVAASIREFGFTNPILLRPDKTIIAGHCRLSAAKKLKMDAVPCIVLSGLTDAQCRALVIADNKLAENASWDFDMLKVEFADLEAMDFNLALTGFGLDEIASLLAPEGTEGLTDEDAVPEAPAVPVTVLGDIWVMGGHRLMCGDSTSVDAMEKLMGGARADLIFTDPPYGMSYEGGRGKKQFGMIKNDDAQGADLVDLVRSALLTAKASTKPGAAAYVCFPWRTYAEFERALNEAGIKVSACIVWDKKSVGLGHQDYRPQHEFIFYSKGGQFFGDRSQSDVWYMGRGNTGDYVHPTQKPVELIERAVTNSSKAGDCIVDCFGGSGSTLVACEKTARAARIMELDPVYCDVIVARWEAFTGGKATRESDGALFSDLAPSVKLAVAPEPKTKKPKKAKG